VWALRGFAVVAWWIPPGLEPDEEAIVAVLTQSVSPQKHEDTFAVLEQKDAAHPTKPFCYLPWLGVDSPHRGAGLGSSC
jgi:hypothetical protein